MRRLFAAGCCILIAAAVAFGGDVAPGCAAEGQYKPSVAYAAEKKVFLVVWEQGSPLGDQSGRGGKAQDIFAARLDRSGVTLDGRGIPVCTGADFQQYPDVASDGVSFLIVWQDMRNGRDYDVYAARVSADGRVLDKDGFLVAGGPHNQCMPRVVWAGICYYVAWLDARCFPEYRVYGARVSASGSVLDAGGVELIRPMSDADVAKWKKAPFAPGKHGDGWHKYVKQPFMPAVAASGGVVWVCSYVDMFGQGGVFNRYNDFMAVRVNAATGRAVEPASAFPVVASVRKINKYLKGTGARVLSAVGVGGGRFLVGVYCWAGGFGASGKAAWGVVPPFDRWGKGLEVKFVAADLEQRWVGYRTSGYRPNVIRLATDGKVVLYVADRIMNTKKGGNRGDIDVMGMFLDTEGRPLGLDGKPSGFLSVKVTGPRLIVEGGVGVKPFAIATGTAMQSLPDACCGGKGRFLVVWQEEAAGQPPRVRCKMIGLK